MPFSRPEEYAMPYGVSPNYRRFECTCCHGDTVLIAHVSGKASTGVGTVQARCDNCRKHCSPPNSRHPQPCRLVAS